MIDVRWPTVEVLEERCRQIDVEGWMLAHDDLHVNGELGLAAVCYILSGIRKKHRLPVSAAALWPWVIEAWKPTRGRRDLVKAAALILAEIERIDRQVEFDADKSPKGGAE